MPATMSVSDDDDELAMTVRMVLGAPGAKVYEHNIAHDKLEFGAVLGEGSFGTVYRAKLRRDGDDKVVPVAVKTMRADKITDRALKEFKAEIEFMRPLKHENLIFVHGATLTDGPAKLTLVLELAEGGSVRTFLNPAKDTGTWRDTRFAMAFGTAKCLRYLHHEQPGDPIIHRDIKGDNVMLTGALVPKVADFGASRHYDEGEAEQRTVVGLTMTTVGTPAYAAPEIIRGGRYTKAVDVYEALAQLITMFVSEDPQTLKPMGFFAQLGPIDRAGTAHNFGGLSRLNIDRLIVSAAIQGHSRWP